MYKERRRRQALNRYSILRWLAYGLELFILFILQETPGLSISILGEKAFLLLPAALSIALFETNLPAMSFGIVAGVLADFGIGHGPGFHAILLAVLCFFLSELATNLIRTNFLTGLLTGILGCAAILFLQWFVFCLMAGSEFPGYILTHHYLPRLLCTVIPVPILYYFNRALGLFIREKE